MLTFYTIVSVALTLICLVALILPGIYLMVRLIVVSEVILYERGGNPIARSWKLTENNALLSFFALIGIMVISTIPATVVAAGAALFPESIWIQVGLEVLEAILGFGVPAIFSLVLYCGLRVKEAEQLESVRG